MRPERQWRHAGTLRQVYGEPQCLLFELLGMALIHHTWAAVKMISSSCARYKIAAPISLYPSCCQFTTTRISGSFGLCKISKMIRPTLGTHCISVLNPLDTQPSTAVAEWQIGYGLVDSCNCASAIKRWVPSSTALYASITVIYHFELHVAIAFYRWYQLFM